jgi:hypothetical protein
MILNDTTESLIINIILMIIAIFSIRKDIYKKEFSGNFFEKITLGGYVFAMCTLLFVWINFVRDSNNGKKLEISENRKAKVDSLLINSYDKLSATSESLRITQSKFSALQLSMRDTILSHVESSNTRIITATNNGLEKYNLVFIDSLKTIKPINKPQITFLAAGESPPEVYQTKGGDKTNLVLKIKSVNNVSYHIDLNYFVFALRDVTNNQVQSKLLAFSDSSSAFEHSMLIPGNIAYIRIPIAENWLVYKCLIFFYGNFSYSENETDKKIFKDGLIYDFGKKKNLGYIRQSTMKQVIKSLKNKGFKIE